MHTSIFIGALLTAMYRWVVHWQPSVFLYT